LPDALAHAGVATMDVATGLCFLGGAYAFWRFVRTGRRRDAAVLALVVGLSFLVRFTVVLMLPMFLALALIGIATGKIHRPRRILAGLALLLIAVPVILAIGYLGHISMAPLSAHTFRSERLLELEHRLPGLRIPIPDSYLDGLDRQMLESEPGKTPTYLLGRIRPGSVWYYYPLAALFKWPLGFLGLILARK